MSTKLPAILFMGPLLALVVTACGPDRAGMGSDGREGWGGSAAAPRELVMDRYCERYKSAKTRAREWERLHPARALDQRDVAMLKELGSGCTKGHGSLERLERLRQLERLRRFERR